MSRQISTINVDNESERIREEEQNLKYKRLVNLNDPRYYKLKADFIYLLDYGIKIEAEVGRGGYAVVYQGVSTQEHDKGAKLAVKINFKTVAKEISYIEVAFLTLIRKERNVQRLNNTIECELKTHIITEYFDYDKFINIFNMFSLEDVKHYTLELLIGLRSLKEKGIFHRDIKPGNFLYNRQLKKGIIIDFGLAELDPHYYETIKSQDKSQMNKKQKKQHQLELDLYQKITRGLSNIGRQKIGTQSYMPIQSILRSNNQNYESDIWAVGVILLSFVLGKYNVFNHIRHRPKEHFIMDYLIELAMLFGVEAVTAVCQKHQFLAMFPRSVRQICLKEKAVIQGGFSRQLEDLLMKLLQLDVEKRIKVEEAIKHKFFDSVRSQHSNRKR